MTLLHVAKRIISFCEQPYLFTGTVLVYTQSTNTKRGIVAEQYAIKLLEDTVAATYLLISITECTKPEA